ncbi:hypothetical protein PIGHUM_02749 [Pigmentiphaga humi]|uniref:DUF4142 domain-containing protein n=1 Tax=Pigmentiphaga humi TaxID=2478468 RepID=A0A3P4B324_9BURK|nr:DUF4142 domain-containing protein [Pigmentiphaga humi]VCU70673.1 hypothetical protein PIGHUM_02749 [Pigmentiphaga humi]
MRQHLLRSGLWAVLALGVAGTAGAQAPAAPGGAQVKALDRADRDFLEHAAQSGHAEIAGSRLALEKSANAEVKAFAQKMIDDHTRVGQQLDTLAQGKGYTAPTEPSLVQKAKLKALGLRKDGFDKAYADEIGVSAHEDAVELFEKASANAHDTDVRQFAAGTLPHLKEHLEQAKALRQSVDSARR